jgi:hypothetical protein
MSNEIHQEDEWFIADKASECNFWVFISKPENRKPCYSLNDIAKLLEISNFSAYLGKCSALKKLKAELEK